MLQRQCQLTFTKWVSVSVGWVFWLACCDQGFLFFILYLILLYWKTELTFLVVRKIEGVEIPERVDL